MVSMRGGMMMRVVMAVVMGVIMGVIMGVTTAFNMMVMALLIAMIQTASAISIAEAVERKFAQMV